MTTYLRAFTLASQGAEEDFWSNSENPKSYRTCYTTHYPFGVFRRREIMDGAEKCTRLFRLFPRPRR